MACKEIPHPKSSHSPSSDSSSNTGTPESFNLETRYIVLNFLSQNPHERHPGCIYSSTASSAASDSNPIHFHSKKGHQSFPTSPRKSTKKHKLGQLDASLRSSEDNVNYKYHKEHREIHRKDDTSNDSSDVPYFLKPQKSVSVDRVSDKRHFKSLSLDHGLNQGRYFLCSETSPVVDESKISASTPFLNYRQTRQESELSSDTGNLSYASDADDEYESTSSSLYNSFTEGRGSKHSDFGFHKLATLKSESDLDTDLSTVTGDTSVLVASDQSGHGNQSTDNQATDNVFDDSPISILQEPEMKMECERVIHLQSSEADVEHSERVTAESSSMSIDITSSSSTAVRPAADRSKLRLIIRDQQEWESEQQSQIQQVLATVEEEVNTQMIFLESEVEEAIRRNQITRHDSPFIVPLSPHTEAAMTLARIGDEIKDYYGDRLNAAVAGLCSEERPVITYEQFRCVACSVIDQVVPGWRQIAFLLVYGQSVVWRVAEFGYREFGDLANNTARLISELFSDFITSQGGWGAVVNYDSSRSSSISPRHSSPEDLLSRDHIHIPTNSSRSQSPLKDYDSKKHSPGKSQSEDPLFKWQPDLLSSSQHIGTSEDYKESDHLISEQNKSSGDHVTSIPPPDEPACDFDHIINEDQHGNAGESCQTVSLGDIQMTFDPSYERIDIQNQFKPITSKNDHETFKPAPDESACFMISIDNNISKDNIREENTVQTCDTDNSHSIWPGEAKIVPHCTNNKCYSCLSNPSSKTFNSDANPCNQFTNVEENVLPNHELEFSIQSSNLSNNNTSQQESSVSLNNDNNGTMLYDSPIVDIPPLDLSGWASSEESESLDNDTVYVPPEPLERPDFFRQFFSIDTFLSLGVCAIGIMAAIALTRK